jgi:hypothetical protein
VRQEAVPRTDSGLFVRAMVQITADGSNPPERRVPIGTSLRIQRDGILEKLAKALDAFTSVFGVAGRYPPSATSASSPLSRAQPHSDRLQAAHLPARGPLAALTPRRRA